MSGSPAGLTSWQWGRVITYLWTFWLFKIDFITLFANSSSHFHTHLCMLIKPWKLQIMNMYAQLQALRQYKDTQKESEVLMKALSAMKDKNAELEKNLCAETRFKQDLFSALSNERNQIKILQSLWLWLWLHIYLGEWIVLVIYIYVIFWGCQGNEQSRTERYCHDLRIRMKFQPTTTALMTLQLQLYLFQGHIFLLKSKIEWWEGLSLSNPMLSNVYYYKHNTELQRTDPGTKVSGEFNTRGHIFSPNVWNEFLSFPSL